MSFPTRYFEDIKVVLLNDAGVEQGDLATWASPQITASTTGPDQVMVRFPKLYYREFYDSNGYLNGIRIDKVPFSGSILHPKFSWGNGRDYIYVGAYEASTVSDMLASVSEQPVTTSVTMAAFESRANARGDGWHSYDFWTQHLIELLFYVYYGTRDSQAVLPGYTQASAWDYAYTRQTGRSNILTTANGSVEAQLGVGEDDNDLSAVLSAGDKIANRFCFIENIFGHIWEFLHGCAVDGRIGKQKTMWATPDYRLFSSTAATVLADYENLNIDLLSVTTTSYIKALGKHLLPVAGGASSSTYYCALMWSYLTDAANLDYLRSVRAGGRLHHGAIAGLAARVSSHSLTDSNASVGSRLCYESL